MSKYQDYNPHHSTAVSISSNTLFHITSRDNLLSILQTDFRPHYCGERFTMDNEVMLQLAIAMVSFCDLPLFLMRSHLEFYGDHGKFGIGLTKKWGMKKNISPVLYLHEFSPLFRFRDRLVNEANQINGGIQKWRMELLDVSNNFTSFLKPYEGNPWRNGEFSKECKRFYNEREWRFVPKNHTPFSSETATIPISSQLIKKL
ncbi:MAG: abortive infection system antitoxin AbiGi family protein [Bacteroidota bacterium]